MSGLKLFVLSGVVVVLLSASLFFTGRDPTTLDTLHVLCAANMRRPVEEAAAEYEREYGVTVELDFDGSGSLLGKLEAEARSEKAEKRGDLYIAADESYVVEAREKGLIVEDIALARMRPVIAVARGNPRGVRGVESLLTSDVRVAICNPDQTAVGRVVRRVIENDGRWKRLTEHAAVTKPKVTDVANDIKLGTVDAGIVWDATVAMYPELEAVRVPEFDAATVGVSVAVTTIAQSPASALRFARFLAARDRGLVRFRAHGFDVVEGDVWEKIPELVVWSGGVNRLAIEKTIVEFQVREGVVVSTTYGGCGALTAQMQPLVGTDRFPDVYFACDRSYMDNVADWYVASQLVAETDIVIAVPRGNPRGCSGLASLARSGLRLGIADAEKSALGALTLRLLDSAGVRGAVQGNITTTAGTADYLVNQITVSGGHSLDAVIVYRANLANVLDRITVIGIEHPAAKAEQPIATSVGSSQRHLARRFIDAILSKRSADRFRAVGFRWRHEPEKRVAE